LILRPIHGKKEKRRLLRCIISRVSVLTGKWQTLADAPHGLDHVQTVVINK
jgi:hypothetical protein